MRLTVKNKNKTKSESRNPEVSFNSLEKCARFEVAKAVSWVVLPFFHQKRIQNKNKSQMTAGLGPAENSSVSEPFTCIPTQLLYGWVPLQNKSSGIAFHPVLTERHSCLSITGARLILVS